MADRRDASGDDIVRQMARFPELNPGPVLRFDPQGNIALANAAARRVFGNEDVAGKNWLSLCPGMTRELWSRILTEQHVTHETEIGERCLMFTHVRPDEPGVVFAFGADVTDHRRAERQLAEQAAVLAEMARFPDMNPGPVLRMKPDGCVVLANAAARELFGVALVGQQWRAMCPGITDEQWWAILQAQSPYAVEARIGSQDFVFAHRRDFSSDLVFVFGANITAQRAAEHALMRSEKMATLGTLAAGVAHELNNPAAATRRAAAQLRDAFTAHGVARRALEGALTNDAWTQLSAFEAAFRERSSVQTLAPVKRADLEADLEDWLDERDIADSGSISAPLVNAGATRDDLGTIARIVPHDALAAACAWFATTRAISALVSEIAEGSARISEIVDAMRSYSYLGQAPIQRVNVHAGLESTLVILRSKLRDGIDVVREYDEQLPEIEAFGSQLNQVWTNILDNAIYATQGRGRIVLRTRCGELGVIVEFEDNGPGIPDSIQTRVFDPFFTTKPPGKGTGLGLATCYSIVTDTHHGSITLDSRAGATRFTVSLPILQPRGE